ncbi:MAG: tRNA (adenosine(37)-N6)-dimethylallyltransferase MiaA [Burkholderiales bacterium PBB6]|nr:MAG: tRNA (adenosine(37)-N6)-dimethylallyltransferase MiaA [Burkholderiales bacterium PBB6]
MSQLPDWPRWVGLAGPTAAGKTAIALRLASVLPVEIISVDSALVYRGMDIGTAKPSAAEQAAAPHHLIDLIEPSESYSAAQFVIDAERLISEIRSRGRLPLLVGGTMMYFKALIDGIDPLPPADANVRAALDAEAAAIGWPAMHDRLASIDPVTAARLSPNDSQRVQRALEVHALTGQPLSSFHTRGKAGAEDAAPADHLLVSVEPDDRAWLHRRIAQRFREMLDAGFIDEVIALRAQPGLHAELPSIRCVGYRQAWEALDAGLSGEALHAEVIERGVAATRQLAKRQITWLRSMQRQAVPAQSPDVGEQVLGLVLRALHAAP